MSNLRQQLAEQNSKIKRLEAELKTLQGVPEVFLQEEDNPLEFLKQKLQVSKLTEERQQRVAQIQSQLDEALTSSRAIQHELERHRRASLMGLIAYGKRLRKRIYC